MSTEPTHPGDDAECLFDERRRNPDAFATRLETYRSALRAYLEENSLRKTSREVGISPTALSEFCRGTTQPLDPTVRKLRTWYRSRSSTPAAASPAPAPRDEPKHLQILRDAVQLRIDRTSTRTVSRDVGVSQGTLYNFVRARVRPYGTTLARLETWFRKLVLSERFPVTRDGQHFVVEPFLAGVPDKLRPAAADKLIAALREIYAGHGPGTPAWLIATDQRLLRLIVNRAVNGDAQVTAAEEEMFADMLYELFLGVLAGGDPAPWFETAAWRLSRGSSPRLLEALWIAHAAGARIEPRAVAMGEAIESLLLADRQPAAAYDFPTELAVLVVSRESAAEILERVRAGLYNSADDVLSSAIFALGWTENHPLGRVELLKHAVRDGSEDADTGRVIPAEEVFRRARERMGG